MAFVPKDSKDRIRHRLKISLGQLKKVQQMFDDGAYCIDVIHQSQAIQKALREVDHLVLESHLKGCVSKAINSGKSDEAIAEVMEIVKKAN